jgi:hypothetical protein
VDWAQRGSIRLLCEDCFEYVTDAMANVWPEKLVTPEVTLKQKDYTKP